MDTIYRITDVGTAERAPRILTLHTPIPSWSGEEGRDITQSDLEALCDFAAAEGARHGRRDAELRRTEDSRRRNPFHPEFLQGVAHGLWRVGYRRAYHAHAMAQRPLNAWHGELAAC